jgi:hypothetical protein
MKNGANKTYSVARNPKGQGCVKYEAIPLDQMPTLDNTIQEVLVWHASRAVLAAPTFLDAAIALGVSKKTLYMWRAEFHIDDHVAEYRKAVEDEILSRTSRNMFLAPPVFSR